MHNMMKVFSSFKEFYNDINGATLTGAIDVIVVEQADGTYNCSPFHVRFGKLGVLRSREKVVDIEINGEPQDIHMKLGESGEAFFVEELEDDENEIPDHLATSPIPVSEFENLFKAQGRRRSFDLTTDLTVPALENEVNDYSKRRNTADNDNTKTRERSFLQRQIVLGNIDICENSAEDLTMSVHSAKLSSEDVSKSIDVSETIFKMDSLDMDLSKAEEDVNKTPMQKIDENGLESKSSKKKRKKMRRKNATRKTSQVVNPCQSSSNSEGTEKISDNATDRSSLNSNSSEPELQKLEKDDPSKCQPDASNIKMIDADFHFFSDTELTSNNNADSRSGTPMNMESVLSDSEFEVKVRKEDLSENSKSWEWGGFPSVPVNSPESETPSKEEQKSMLNGLFSFMKQKHSVQSHLQGGMYLSDISSGCMDPQVAEIYFNTPKDGKHADADMDCESGNGPSLAQSPNSAEGCKSIDSDFDEHKQNQQIFSHDISLSLCGWEPLPTKDRFLENVVKFSDLCNNPALLENNNLVVRIKEKYYTWKVAAPIMASIQIYGRPLLQSSVDQLVSVHMPTTTTSLQDKEEHPKQEYRSWWSWRRRATSRETTPANESVTDNKTADTKDIDKKESDKSYTGPDEVLVTTPVKDHVNVELYSTSPDMSPSSDKCRKTLRLSSKQIASLNLQDGVNELEFSVTTAYQGTSRCQCNLYKWKWDDKIVISDIDGTITKSDVLGHILPIVGKDWAQTGVAQLFNKIKDNGYKLLYLSARAIGQARITREYLKSIKQGDLSMPDGPILLNPTSLITAFHREVIEKKPEQFKISCMSDIKALFPLDSNPFYAGYGNRINDVWAYRAVGIPIVRIFTINPKGELKHELTQTFQSSYPNMTSIVDQLFPPVLQAANDYSQFIYWRDPLNVLEDVPELPEIA